MNYKNIIKSPHMRLKLIQMLRWIPDELYLKIAYRIKSGKKLNLKHPKTLCDKLNWLKLHDQHPEYARLVDKITVREHLREVLGEDISISVLGVWAHYDEIDFDALPEQFVLKCNHDSGSTRIIRDKKAIDHAELRKFFEEKLQLNHYVVGREYLYREIPPKIYAEAYMVPQGGQDLNDYKFFCFHGEPEILLVTSNRSTDCRFDFFDMAFTHLNIERIYPPSEHPIPKPACFEEMKQLARKLSAGMKFVRIDLYEIEGKVYFGEYTFCPAGGLWPLKPEKWEYVLGDKILLD